MREEGYVHSVEVVTAGSYLDGTHTAGTTTLKVMDAADFNEEGGSFIMDGVVRSYVSADLEADTLTLAAALPSDVEESTALSITPLTYEKQALVVVDDYDEAITAVIPHTLYDKLAEGMREDGQREPVSIELRGNVWYVEDVYGLQPSISSPNYEPGLSGWKIASDGSAEFNEVTLRNGQVLSGKSLFYASNPPGLGNLIFSVAAATGTDPFGNAHKAGMTSYSESGNININGTNATWEHSSGSKIELSIGGAQASIKLTPPTQSGVTWQEGTIGTHRTTDHGTNTPGLFMQGPSTTTNTAKAQIELLGGSPTQNKSMVRMTAQTTRVVGDLDVTGQMSLGNMRMGQVRVTNTTGGTPASVTVTYAALPAGTLVPFTAYISTVPGNISLGVSAAFVTASSMAVYANRNPAGATDVSWQIWSI